MIPTGDELERAKRHTAAAAARLAREEQDAAFAEKRKPNPTPTADELLAKMYPEPPKPPTPQGVMKFGVYVPTIEEIMEGGARTKAAAKKILVDIEAQAEAARIAQENAEKPTGETGGDKGTETGGDTIGGGDGNDNTEPANG